MARPGRTEIRQLFAYPGLRALCVLGGVGFLSGCYDTEQVCLEAGEYEAAVELGTWVNQGFAPIEDGDVLPAIFGPQGGEHLPASVQTTGVHPGNGEMVEESGGLLGFLFPPAPGATVPKGQDPVTLTFRLQYEQGLIEPNQVVLQTFLDGSVESAVSQEQTVFFSTWEIAEAYPDQDLVDITMRVKLVDACGTSVEDLREIQVENPRY